MKTLCFTCDRHSLHSCLKHNCIHLKMTLFMKSNWFDVKCVLRFFFRNYEELFSCSCFGIVCSSINGFSSAFFDKLHLIGLKHFLFFKNGTVRISAISSDNSIQIIINTITSTDIDGPIRERKINNYLFWYNYSFNLLTTSNCTTYHLFLIPASSMWEDLLILNTQSYHLKKEPFPFRWWYES